MMTSKEMTLECHNAQLLQYAKSKIVMLKKHFGIKLDETDIDNFMKCTSEIAVDNYAHKIIMTKL